MAVKTWKIQPIYATVMEILQKKNSMTDSELLEFLRAFDKDIGLSELNATLMKMEVTGLITVSSLTRGKRLVDLARK